MQAKDTVMSEAELESLELPSKILTTHFSLGGNLTYLLNKQAEISFAAGKQEGFIEGQANTGHNEAILAAVKAARKEGIREVCEWIDANKNWIVLPNKIWQEFKKSRGIA